jgi:hypothetical protein
MHSDSIASTSSVNGFVSTEDTSASETLPEDSLVGAKLMFLSSTSLSATSSAANEGVGGSEGSDELLTNWESRELSALEMVVPSRFLIAAGLQDLLGYAFL